MTMGRINHPNYTPIQSSKIQVFPTKHFLKRQFERGFPLTTVKDVYSLGCQTGIGKTIKTFDGIATIVAVRATIDTVLLVTGWLGEQRLSKKRLEMIANGVVAC